MKKLVILLKTLLIVSLAFGKISFYKDEWTTITTNKFILKVDGNSDYNYCASSGGLLQYDLYGKRWSYNFSWTELGFEHFPHKMWIKSDTLFFLYDNSVFFITEFDLGWEQVSSTERDSISPGEDVCPDEFESYFAPDDYFFDTEGVLSDMYLREFPVTTCHKDHMNDYWLGTWGCGLLKVPYLSLSLRLENYGLINKDVRAIAKAGDKYFFGGVDWTADYGGLSIYDARRDRWSYIEEKSRSFMRSHKITSMVGLGDSLLLAGTMKGLMIYDIQKDDINFKDRFDGIATDEVLSIYHQPGTDIIWVGCDDGISKGDLSIMQFKELSPVDFWEVYDFEYAGEDIWAATEDGPYFLTTRGWRHLGTSDGFTDGYNWGISAYGEFIWFITELGLLQFHMETHETRTYPAPTYLPRVKYNDILATERYIWLASDQGVIKYRKEDQTWWSYTEDDGLPSNKVWTMMADGDYIYFGTDKGAAKFLWNAPSRIDY